MIAAPGAVRAQQDTVRPSTPRDTNSHAKDSKVDRTAHNAGQSINNANHAVSNGAYDAGTAVKNGVKGVVGGKKTTTAGDSADKAKKPQG